MNNIFKYLFSHRVDRSTTDLDTKLTERNKQKAAYALNLCTVSISQIIDYEDINILEQEYEMILNNLNLENFPKDESLLHILKQILDTVTFFRIHEGDKRIQDQKYQQKMKNAIWSAIPNFTFVAGGNPYALAVSAIAAVGMGYMNYRKEKAKIRLEHEEEIWKLQRSAIEQFNGLRRELFDTAWRLSDKYGFKDEYRLTEKQISTYNSILMDPIPLRKYERLSAIKNFFVAYPPFWYYLGNAAVDVANEYKKSEFFDPSNCQEAYSNYLLLAEQHFNQYLESDHSLLRTDYIRSSCSLEYAALLLEREKNSDNLFKFGNKDLLEKVKLLISDAERYSSGALDVLQICAMYSLRIGDAQSAQKLLRKLVVEGFNTTTNAQLLSYVYLNMVFADKADKAIYNTKTTEYKELILFTEDASMLLPWIENADISNEDAFNNICSQFYVKQKNRIQNQFNAVVDKIIERYAIRYNKELFTPRNDSDHVDDSFFTDSESSIEKRKKEYSRICNNQTDWSLFVNDLRVKKIALVLNKQLNEVFNLLSLLVTPILNRDIEAIHSVRFFNESFKEDHNQEDHNQKDNNQLFKEIMDKVEKNTFDKEDCDSLLCHSFTSILKKYIDNFKEKVGSEIDKRKNLGELMSIECELADFCNANNLPSPKELYGDHSRSVSEENKRKFINLLSFFDGGAEMEQNAAIEDEIRKKIETFINEKKLEKTEDEGQQNIEFTIDEQRFYEIRKRLSKNDLTTITNYGNILAYFNDNKKWYNRYKKLYFLREGFVLISDATLLSKKIEFYRYTDIQYDSSRHCIYTDKVDEIYSSKNVNVETLYNLIKELKSISSCRADEVRHGQVTSVSPM